MSVSARVPVFTRPTNPSARLSYRPERRQSEPEQVVNHHEQEEETVRRAVTPAPIVEHAPVESMSPHAIATPAPDLLFAIASDDANEVKRVLEDGIAGPNEATGPQSALSFALTSDQLTHKLDIVKTLLAFGADPSRAKEELAAQGSQANSWDAATKCVFVSVFLSVYDTEYLQVLCGQGRRFLDSAYERYYAPVILQTIGASAIWDHRPGSSTGTTLAGPQYTLSAGQCRSYCNTPMWYVRALS